MFASPNNLAELVREWQMTPHPEEQLELFNRIVKLVETRLICFLSRFCPSEAADFAQQSLLIAWKRRRSLRNHRLFWPWLRRIAYNLVADHFRNQTRKPIFNCDPSELEAYALRASQAEQEPGGRKAQIEELFAAIKTLDEEDQRIVELRYFFALSWKEVGEVLGKTEDAARMEGNRIRARLRAQLEKQELCEPQEIQ